MDTAFGRSGMNRPSKRQKTDGHVEESNSHTMLLATTKILSKATDDVLKTAIGTHSGTFHCDEALACGMLKLLPRYKDVAIVRTRDASLLDKCDIVVDVGGIYDHSSKRYDHHQRTFTSVYEEIGHKTKLSSAGLVYKHYGREVIKELASEVGASEEDIEQIYLKVYKNFVEEIDGIDNGVECFNSKDRNYAVTTNLSARVGRLNPSWHEPSDDETRNELFRNAVVLTRTEFIQRVHGYLYDWLPAKEIVTKAITKCFEKGERILIFDDYCPWKSHMFDIEEKLGKAGEILYVLYPEDGSTRETGKWRIQAAPVEADSFAQRKSLPEPWRGLRDQELSKVSGIDGCVFVHTAGFIGGNLSFQGAYEMAKKAVAVKE